MDFTLRLFEVDDAPQVAALLAQVDPDPPGIADLIELKTGFPWQDGAFQLLLVAVLPDGRIVGWGEVFRKPWHKAGKFYQFLVVDRSHRRMGVGRALVAALEQYALENGGTELAVDVRDDAPADRAFAERRGYVLDRHIFESVLDVASFDESPFLGAVEQVSREFRILSLADQPGEESERKVYDLRVTTVPDQPSMDGSGAPPFELWRRERLNHPGHRHDLLLIAADGDRFVGETYLRWNEENRSMYTNYTGVLREYRGRQLALVLKVLGVRLARKYGALTMRTNNDSENGPMLAVNRKMGYRPEPGLHFLVKRMEGAKSP
ncbi:MAG: family N-acetyltransferase [Symbiobacteriaceae bacterium]|nr:family N-acetyltransferase [Symbiobacteriaceae bacterium]